MSPAYIALPRSHNFTLDRLAFTSTLSGLMSACSIPHVLSSLSACSSWYEYVLTALRLMPTSLPNFFTTSLKLRSRASKHMHTWLLYSKCSTRWMQWRLPSGSAPLSFLKMLTSCSAAFLITSLLRTTLVANSGPSFRPPTSLALSTVLNTPWPQLAYTS